MQIDNKFNTSPNIQGIKTNTIENLFLINAHINNINERRRAIKYQFPFEKNEKPSLLKKNIYKKNQNKNTYINKITNFNLGKSIYNEKFSEVSELDELEDPSTFNNSKIPESFKSNRPKEIKKYFFTHKINI